MKSQAAITLLEAALTMVFVCFLLLVSAGLWDYLKSSFIISEILEYGSSRAYEGVFTYKKHSNAYETDYQKIKNLFSNEVVKSASLLLLGSLSAADLNNTRIEFLFVTAIIDPKTGSFMALKDISEEESIVQGVQQIPAFLSDGNKENGELDFRAALDAYVRENYENLAIPSLNYGNSGINNQYLAEVPLLASRALYNFGESSILYSLGILDHTYVWDIKVSALRGDL